MNPSHPAEQPGQPQSPSQRHAGHGGADGADVDWATQTEQLTRAADRDAKWLARAARDLLRSGQRLAVDLGCGGGGMAVALAEQGPSELTVTGLDGEPALIAAAAERARRIGGPAGRVRFAVARMEDGAERLRAAAGGAPDLLWAAAAVHHAPDPQHTVTELARTLADGGVLALAEGGLPMRCLPTDLGVGEEPGLEARLDVAQAVWFRRMRAAQPEVVPMPYGWPETLRRAGLADVSTRSYLLERSVPPGSPEMDDLLYTLGNRIDRLLPDELLGAADRAVWARLLNPADPVWLGRRADLFHLAAISVHSGYRA